MSLCWQQSLTPHCPLAVGDCWDWWPDCAATFYHLFSWFKASGNDRVLSEMTSLTILGKILLQKDSTKLKL